jgi:DNA-binding transcriptional ArsR family regulator
MRFKVVEILRDGELPVSHIVGSVEIDQSGVSRPLRILDEASFVQMRPEGQKRLYSLRPEFSRPRRLDFDVSQDVGETA